MNVSSSGTVAITAGCSDSTQASCVNLSSTSTGVVTSRVRDARWPSPDAVSTSELLKAVKENLNESAFDLAEAIHRKVVLPPDEERPLRVRLSAIRETRRDVAGQLTVMLSKHEDDASFRREVHKLVNNLMSGPDPLPFE